MFASLFYAESKKAIDEVIGEIEVCTVTFCYVGVQYVTLRIIVHSQESKSELPAETKKVSTSSITSWALKV